MKFKCIITTRTGETVNLDLSCREYHANKLNYILSRTLDRSVYTGAEVVAGFNSPAVEAAARLHVKKPVLVEKSAAQIEEEKKEIAELWAHFCAIKEYLKKYHENSVGTLELEKAADSFWNCLKFLSMISRRN